MVRFSGVIMTLVSGWLILAVTVTVAQAKAGCAHNSRYLQKTADGYHLRLRPGCAKTSRSEIFIGRKKSNPLKKQAEKTVRLKRKRRANLQRFARKARPKFILMKLTASEYLVARRISHRRYVSQKRNRYGKKRRSHTSYRGYSMVFYQKPNWRARRNYRRNRYRRRSW